MSIAIGVGGGPKYYLYGEFRLHYFLIETLIYSASRPNTRIAYLEVRISSSSYTPIFGGGSTELCGLVLLASPPTTLQSTVDIFSAGLS